MLLKQQIKISGIVCVLLVALVVWILSCGVFKGTPERHLKRNGDIYALVPCQDGRRGPATATEEQREAFYQAPDTWFDKTTPKNLDRKDICEKRMSIDIYAAN